MAIDFPASPTTGDQHTAVNLVWEYDGEKWVTLKSLFDRGTTSPGTEAEPGAPFTGDPDTGIYSPGADQFAVTTNGTGRLFIDASGNVGVGTTNPGANLEIKAASIPAIRLNQADTYYAPIKLAGNDLEIRGSSGTIEFYNGANNGDSSTEKMRIDGSGNVGINNSSPGSYASDARNLVVGSGSGNNGLTVASGSSSHGTIYFADGTSGASLYTGTITYNHASNYMAFWANESERMRLDSSGRLGVGTSSPDANSQLHVVGSSSQPLYINTTGAGGGGAAFSQSGTKALYTGTAGSSWLTGSATTDGLIRAEANLILATNGNTQAVTIDSSQRVGIGTTSPTKALEVTAGSTSSGGLLVTGSSSPQIRLEEATGVTGSLQADASAIYLGTVSNHPLILRTNVAERARIDSSGNVGIGKSSSLGAKLHIQDDSATETTLIKLRNYKASVNTQAGILFECSTSGNQGGNSLIKGVCGTDAGGSNSLNDGGLAFQTGSGGSGTLATRLLITSSGRLGIGTTSPASLLSVDKGIVTNRGQWSDCGIALHNPTNIGAYSQIGFGYTPSQTYASAYIGYLSTNQGASGYGDIVFGTRSVNTDSQPSERMRIDSSGSVQISMGGSGYSTLFRYGSNEDNYIRSGVNGFTAFGDHNGGERMRIDSSGNVGIGTTSPSSLLELGGVSNPQITLDGTASSGHRGLIFSYIGTQFGQLGQNVQSGELLIRSGEPGQTGYYINFSVNGSDAARIDPSGRLLVGTSSSRAVLSAGSPGLLQVEVNGTVAYPATFMANRSDQFGPILGLCKSRGTTSGSQTIVQSGDILGNIIFGGTDGSDEVPGASIATYVDGTPGANDMPGRLVFSTTADGASSPTERMRISSNGTVTIQNGNGAQIYGTDTNSNIGVFYARNDNTTAANAVAAFATGTNSTATSNVLVKFGINYYGSGSGQINANGAGQVAFGFFSDERLKENITDLPSQWQNIKNLRPVEFDFVESQGGEHQIGFIAQEFQSVYPDAVGSQPLFNGLDEDTTEERLTLTDWSKTDTRLVKALQEAMERIETLEAKVAALEVQ